MINRRKRQIKLTLAIVMIQWVDSGEKNEGRDADTNPDAGIHRSVVFSWAWW